MAGATASSRTPTAIPSRWARRCDPRPRRHPLDERDRDARDGPADRYAADRRAGARRPVRPRASRDVVRAAPSAAVLLQSHRPAGRRDRAHREATRTRRRVDRLAPRRRRARSPRTPRHAVRRAPRHAQPPSRRRRHGHRADARARGAGGLAAERHVAHGRPLGVLPLLLEWADQLCACGPWPMLAAIGRLREQAERGPAAPGRAPLLDAQIAVEQHMGCAMGVCRACVVVTAQGNARVCREGPVFALGDIAFDQGEPATVGIVA
ncbi:MAG: hypothetical protein E6I51_09180 [Chloroflexi bacterium]|nr:MAG: hypothetical protein E6I51_09180 [Chloroflexota bacterium]